MNIWWVILGVLVCAVVGYAVYAYATGDGIVKRYND
jgi:hypothetical protein